jgi:cytochrome c553
LAEPLAGSTKNSAAETLAERKVVAVQEKKLRTRIWDFRMGGAPGIVYFFHRMTTLGSGAVLLCRKSRGETMIFDLVEMTWAKAGLLAIILSGCNPDNPNQLLPGSGSSPDPQNPSGDGPAIKNEARVSWKGLEADMLLACGTCHNELGQANTPFLRTSDPYQSIVSWPGVVKANPNNSILLTYPITGKGHSGTNLDSTTLKDTLLPKVQAWLAAEAENFTAPPANVGPHIEAFVPIMGFNAVYLDALGPDYEGAAVTFRAQLVDTTLSLDNIEVQPTATTGLHIVHPLFLVHPLGKEPEADVVDSFSNFDHTFEAGESDLMGPGTVILVNWLTDAKLSFAFEKITKVSPPAGGSIGGCKNVPSFEANASGWLNTCAACHNGTDSQAFAAVDMSKLSTDPAIACGQVRNRVNPSKPASSQIFVTTDPNGNAAHPYKFNGDVASYNNFRDAMSLWIMTEE